MASLRCLSSSYKDVNHKHGVSSRLKLAALTLNADGTRAAYAIRRSRVLPSEDDVEDPAHRIFIARTRARSSTEGSITVETAGTILPFAEWSVTEVLSGIHTSPVTTLSWCSHASGALVSASVDRCVYVWTPKQTREGDGESATESSSSSHDAPFFNAVPQLVMLSPEVQLSPTAVVWSAHGNKLYIGTAGGTVAVGRYDSSQQWWICRVLLSAHHHTVNSSMPSNSNLSTAAVANADRPSQQNTLAALSTFTAQRDRLVVSLAPHPSDNTKVAVAFLNGTVHVLSTHMKAVDGGLEGNSTSKGSEDEAERTCGKESCMAVKPFGHVHWSCSIPCWLHCLSWSPTGRQLAVVGHDSALHTWSCATTASADQYVGKGRMKHTALRLRMLPLVQCMCVSDGLILAAGFEGRVCVFGAVQEGMWHLVAEGETHETSTATTKRAVTDDALSHTRPSERKETATSLSAADEKRNAVVGVVVDAAVESKPNAKSVRQRALELLLKGSGLPPRATAVKAKMPQHGEENTQQSASHASSTPIQLLVSVSQLNTMVIASKGKKPVRQEASTFVSASSDGCVQVWYLDDDDKLND